MQYRYTVKTTRFIFIRLECIWGKSWIYSVGQKNSLRAFGYNSAESEPI